MTRARPLERYDSAAEQGQGGLLPGLQSPTCAQSISEAEVADLDVTRMQLARANTSALARNLWQVSPLLDCSMHHLHNLPMPMAPRTANLIELLASILRMPCCMLHSSRYLSCAVNGPTLLTWPGRMV